MKIRYIDSLRGVAILMVIMIHCYQFGNNTFLPKSFVSVLNSGRYGVQLFFMISGFTLFSSIKERNESSYLPYFVRRFFRIAPLYYIAIIYFLFQNGFDNNYWLGDYDHISSYNIFANIFFIHGFNPYWINSIVPGGWSIAVEMTFYLILPLIIRKINSSKHAIIFIISTLILRLVLQLIFERNNLIGSNRLWDDYLTMYLPNQLPIFGLGILFYFMKKENERLEFNSNIYIIIFCILFGWLLQIIPILSSEFLFAFCFYILFIILNKTEYVLIVNSFTTFVGKLSYGIYFVHFGVLYWFDFFEITDFLSISNYKNCILNYIIRYLLILITSIIISFVLNRLIELPFQNIGIKIVRKYLNKK